MGGLLSRHQFNPNNQFPGQQLSTLTVASKLGLSRREVNTLFAMFQGLDERSCGLVCVSNFLDVCDADVSWMRRLFAANANKIHKNSSLNFLEFLTILWDICSADLAMQATWIFHFFNRGKQENEMNDNDVNRMIDTIWGRRQKSVLEVSMSDLNRKELSLADFLDIVASATTMLFPVIQLQTHIRQDTLSITRWSQLSVRRRNLFDDDSVQQIVSDCCCCSDAEKSLHTVTSRTFHASSASASARASLGNGTGHAPPHGISESVRSMETLAGDCSLVGVSATAALAAAGLAVYRNGGLLTTPPTPLKPVSAVAVQQQQQLLSTDTNGGSSLLEESPPVLSTEVTPPLNEAEEEMRRDNFESATSSSTTTSGSNNNNNHHTTGSPPMLVSEPAVDSERNLADNCSMNVHVTVPRELEPLLLHPAKFPSQNGNSPQRACQSRSSFDVDITSPRRRSRPYLPPLQSPRPENSPWGKYLSGDNSGNNKNNNNNDSKRYSRTSRRRSFDEEGPYDDSFAQSSPPRRLLSEEQPQVTSVGVPENAVEKSYFKKEPEFELNLTL